MSPAATPAARPAPALHVVAAIPARYGSTRLPGKALRTLAGKPLIEHVYQRVAAAADLERVVVLTDDRRIAEAVESFGGSCEMTPATCTSGTDRIAWAAKQWDFDAVVNVQGDEPLLDGDDLAAVIAHLRAHPEDPMVTLATPCPPDLFSDPAAVKVVTDQRGYALYFSRAPIPYPRNDGGPEAQPRLHVGVYGFQRQALERFASLPPSPLESRESLEQLRALENGLAIRVLPAARPSIGVDTEDDLRRVEKLLRND